MLEGIEEGGHCLLWAFVVRLFPDIEDLGDFYDIVGLSGLLLFGV